MNSSCRRCVRARTRSDTASCGSAASAASSTGSVEGEVAGKRDARPPTIASAASSPCTASAAYAKHRRWTTFTMRAGAGAPGDGAGELASRAADRRDIASSRAVCNGDAALAGSDRHSASALWCSVEAAKVHLLYADDEECGSHAKSATAPAQAAGPVCQLHKNKSAARRASRAVLGASSEDSAASTAGTSDAPPSSKELIRVRLQKLLGFHTNRKKRNDIHWIQDWRKHALG